MPEDLLKLTVTQSGGTADGARIRYVVDDPSGAALAPDLGKDLDPGLLAAYLRQAGELATFAAERGPDDSATPAESAAFRDAVEERLQRLGHDLWRTLLPAEVQDLLRRSQAEHLLLQLGPELLPVPWEIVRDPVEGAFLCRRFGLSRATFGRVGRRPAPRTDTVEALLVHDPTGTLRWAPREVADVRKALEEGARHGAPVRATVQGGDRARRERILSDMEGRTLVHFSGHAVFDRDRPERSGWRFARGEVLEARLVRDLVTPPRLVFSNACESAAAADGGSADHYGFQPHATDLARAFLEAGVEHYVGTQWVVRDEAAVTDAAAHFHRELVGGATVGGALRRAREAVAAEHGEGNLAWACPLLYGDPRARLTAGDDAPAAGVQVDRDADVQAPAGAGGHADPVGIQRPGERDRSGRSRRAFGIGGRWTVVVVVLAAVAGFLLARGGDAGRPTMTVMTGPDPADIAPVAPGAVLTVGDAVSAVLRSQAGSQVAMVRVTADGYVDWESGRTDGDGRMQVTTTWSVRTPGTEVWAACAVPEEAPERLRLQVRQAVKRAVTVAGGHAGTGAHVLPAGPAPSLQALRAGPLERAPAESEWERRVVAALEAVMPDPLILRFTAALPAPRARVAVTAVRWDPVRGRVLEDLDDDGLAEGEGMQVTVTCANPAHLWVTLVAGDRVRLLHPADPASPPELLGVLRLPDAAGSDEWMDGIPVDGSPAVVLVAAWYLPPSAADLASLEQTVRSVVDALSRDDADAQEAARVLDNLLAGAAPAHWVIEVRR